MGFLTASEFGIKYDIARTNVYTYSDRGKIVMIDGLIDETNPINTLFIEKLKFKRSNKGPGTTKNINIINTIPKEQSIEDSVSYQKTKEKIVGLSKDNEKESGVYASHLRYVDQLKTQKLEEEIAELKRKNQKDAGELIRMDEVMNVFTIHFRNIITTFYNTADNYTSDLCTRFGADRTVIAEFRQKLKKVINETVETAKDQSKKDLLNTSGIKN